MKKRMFGGFLGICLLIIIFNIVFVSAGFGQGNYQEIGHWSYELGYNAASDYYVNWNLYAIENTNWNLRELTNVIGDHDIYGTIIHSTIYGVANANNAVRAICTIDFVGEEECFESCKEYNITWETGGMVIGPSTLLWERFISVEEALSMRYIRFTQNMGFPMCTIASNTPLSNGTCESDIFEPNSTSHCNEVIDKEISWKEVKCKKSSPKASCSFKESLTVSKIDLDKVSGCPYPSRNYICCENNACCNGRYCNDNGGCCDRGLDECNPRDPIK